MAAWCTSAVAQSVAVKDIDPFSRPAFIAADADLLSIRFQNAKLVKVHTKVRITTNDFYCQQVTFRDPGGSSLCQNIQFEASVPAYEVTYSYVGRPMTSDEYGGKNFTFSVYFRPEELSVETREAISRRKSAKTNVAEFFYVDANRDLQWRPFIDKINSTFCPGSYIDGNWMQMNPACKEQVSSKLESVPGEYVTVSVTPLLANGRSAVVATDAKTFR
jgi:hypothetical protein